MDLIQETITTLVPEIPIQELEKLASHLHEEGYRVPKDLLYLEAEDLKPYLKTLLIRKLLHLIKVEFQEPASSHEVTISRPTVSGVLQGNKAGEVRSRTAIDRWAETFEVDWTAMPVELVQACEENKVPEPQLRRKLVKLLGEAIAAHSVSPTTYQVNKIALTIVEKYQSSFADITSTGDLIGDGTASLTRQLMVYLENRRRPHRSTKRSAEPAECSATPSKQAKETDSYGCAAWAPDCTPYTWEELEEKRKQIHSATSFPEISSTMQETYALQRRQINSGLLTIPQIGKAWPHLFKESIFVSHLNTLLGFPYQVTFVHELSTKGVRIFDTMLKTWAPRTRPLLQAIQEMVDPKGQVPPRHLFVPELLAGYFTESIETLISFHAHASVDSVLETCPVSPHLAVIGSTLLDDPLRIALVVDQAFVLETTRVETAYGLLLGAYFFFNIKYPDGAQHTLEFLQRYFGQINPRRGTRGAPCHTAKSGIHPKVLRLIKEVK
ncbi:uncharacterized protein ISCGN_002441 [Ixodes scapularis]